MTNGILIAPSLLSADFGYLADEAQRIEAGGADLLHYDVMDGKFVPPITFGSGVLAAIKKRTKLPLDAHLMVQDPDIYQIDAFCGAGADYVSIHYAACTHIDRALQSIKDRKVKAGIAFNPGENPASVSRYILDGLVDFVLFMTVNPGYGGQSFIPGVLPNIKYIRDMNPNIPIEVDGGIDYRVKDSTTSTRPSAYQVARAGANIIVAGSAVFQERFKGENYRTPIGALREAANAAKEAALK